MAMIDREALLLEMLRSHGTNKEFFVSIVERQPVVKNPVLSCEGFKMFRGVMRITPKNPKFTPKEIEADWLYKPEYDCWYGGGCSYPAEICERIE